MSNVLEGSRIKSTLTNEPVNACDGRVFIDFRGYVQVVYTIKGNWYYTDVDGETYRLSEIGNPFIGYFDLNDSDLEGYSYIDYSRILTDKDIQATGSLLDKYKRIEEQIEGVALQKVSELLSQHDIDEESTAGILTLLKSDCNPYYMLRELPDIVAKHLPGNAELQSEICSIVSQAVEVGSNSQIEEVHEF